jgi:hypothetical protein
MPEKEGSPVRTIVLSRELGWLELDPSTGESVARTTIPERSLRSLSALPVATAADAAGHVDTVSIAAQ